MKLLFLSMVMCARVYPSKRTNPSTFILYYRARVFCCLYDDEFKFLSCYVLVFFIIFFLDYHINIVMCIMLYHVENLIADFLIS